MGIWNTKGIDTNWRMWNNFQSCFHFFFCIELPSNIVKYHQIHLIVIPQKYRSKLISDPILFDKSNRNEPVHQQTKEIFLRSKEFRKKQFSCWMNGIAPICEGDGISHQMRKRWRGWIKLFCPLNPWRWQTFCENVTQSYVFGFFFLFKIQRILRWFLWLWLIFHMTFILLKLLLLLLNAWLFERCLFFTFHFYF